MLVKQLEVLGQENRALREAAGRASALEREREALLARLRLLSFAAGAALLLILILVYLVNLRRVRRTVTWSRHVGVSGPCQVDG